MQGTTGLAAVVLLLGELSLALGAGCAVLGWTVLRHRRTLRAGRVARRQGQAERSAYQGYLHQQLAAARRGASGDAPGPRRLLVEYLEGELKVLAGAGADGDPGWALRHAHAVQVIEKLRQLQATPAAAMSPPASGEGDRVRRLEAYRERFNRLHGHALEERAASRELRAGLREELPGSLRARELLERYERRRGPLDGFLEAPEVDPLARRHRAGPEAVDPRGRLRRTRVLVDANQREMDVQGARQRSILQEQDVLIQNLKSSLEAAESASDAQRERHLRQVKALEEKLRQAELCTQTVEKESLRRQRVIRDLLKRLEASQQTAAEVQGLEDTIDRFCEQAVEMQGRVRSLEERLARADAEVLLLKSRDAEPLPEARQ